MQPGTGALPNIVVIGAMKCGTTALHDYLDLHPEIAMSQPKELNFFIGRDSGPADVDWRSGNWHRGADWYAGRFDPEATVRGESSPGYTSPAHPEAAARMAEVIPNARLIFLVRDPVARAVSQYQHHRRDGTEPRSLEDALLDPGSQYISRGCYFQRLQPYLDTGRFEGRIAVVAQEELRLDRRSALAELFGYVQVDDDYWTDDMHHGRNESDQPAPELPARLRHRLADALRPDADRLRELVGRDFPDWSV